MRSLFRSFAVITALSLPSLAYASGITYTAIPTLNDITNPGAIGATFNDPTISFIDPPSATATDDFTVYALIGNYKDDVELDVAFSSPGTGTAAITGDAKMNLQWFVSSDGTIAWDDAFDTITLSDGSVVTISLPAKRNGDPKNTKLEYAGFIFNSGDSSLNVTVDSPAPAAAPEPSSLMLLGTGVLGAAGMLRRRFAL